MTLSDKRQFEASKILIQSENGEDDYGLLEDSKNLSINSLTAEQKMQILLLNGKDSLTAKEIKELESKGYRIPGVTSPHFQHNMKTIRSNTTNAEVKEKPKFDDGKSARTLSLSLQRNKDDKEEEEVKGTTTSQSLKSSKEQSKKWRENHKEYSREYGKKYYEEHKEEILAKRKAKRQREKELLSQLINV